MTRISRSNGLRVLLLLLVAVLVGGCGPTLLNFSPSVKSEFALDEDALGSLQFYVRIPDGNDAEPRVSRAYEVLILRFQESSTRRATEDASLVEEVEIREIDFVVRDGLPGVFVGMEKGDHLVIDIGSGAVLEFEPAVASYRLAAINGEPYGAGESFVIDGVTYRLEGTRAPEVLLGYEENEDLERIRERRRAEGRTIRR